MKSVRIIFLSLLVALSHQPLFAANVSGFIRDGRSWVGVYRTGVIANGDPAYIFELMIELKKLAELSPSLKNCIRGYDIQKELCRYNVSGSEITTKLLVEKAVAICSCDSEIFLVRNDFLSDLQSLFQGAVFQPDSLTDLPISSGDLKVLLADILKQHHVEE